MSRRGEGLRRNGGFRRAGRVLVDLAAAGAGVIRVVAIRGAGRRDGLGLNHGMAVALRAAARGAAARGAAGRCPRRGPRRRGTAARGDTALLAVRALDADVRVAGVLDVRPLGLHGHVRRGFHVLHRAVAGHGGVPGLVLDCADGRAAAGVDGRAVRTLADLHVVDLGLAAERKLRVLAANVQVADLGVAAKLELCAVAGHADAARVGAVEDDLRMIARDIDAARAGVLDRHAGAVARDVYITELAAAAHGNVAVIARNEQRADLTVHGHVVRNDKRDAVARAGDGRAVVLDVVLDGLIENGHGGCAVDVILRGEPVAVHTVDDARRDECRHHAARVGRDLRLIAVLAQIGVCRGADAERTAQHDHGAFTRDGPVRVHRAVAIAHEDARRRTAVDGILIPRARLHVGEASASRRAQTQQVGKNGRQLRAGQRSIGIKLAVIALHDAVFDPAPDSVFGPVAVHVRELDHRGSRWAVRLQVGQRCRRQHG